MANSILSALISMVYSVFPEEMRIATKLLNRSARAKFLFLTTLQIVSASFEVFALTVISLTIAFSLSSFTTLNPQRGSNLDFLQQYLSRVSPETGIAILLLLYVGLTVFKTLLSAAVTYSSLNLLAKESAAIGSKLNLALYKHDASLIRFNKSQENLSGVTSGVDSMVIYYLGTISLLAGDISTVLVVSIAMFFLDFETALLLIILFSLLLSYLHRHVNRVAGDLSTKVAKAYTELNRRLLDSWLIYRELMLAKKVGEFMTPTLELRREVSSGSARLNFLPNLSKYIFELFLVISALVISGFQLIINGASEALASFILIIAASARLLPVVLRLQGSLLSIKQSKGRSLYTNQLIGQLREVDIFRKIEQERMRLEGDFCATVDMKNLSFVYPDSHRPALIDINLSIESGTFVAVTGPSGSGKSTLVDVILGFLQPSSGTITLGGFEPGLSRELWPGEISYVPQDVQIIEGSILENITLSSEKISDLDSLNDCIRASGLLDDIENLANGLETEVGERGLKLSGGQRQRLGIARALYRKPKLLIFDEATSSLDPITESKITSNIFRSNQKRTTIVIAHRLSTVKSAHRVIYLKDGRLIASGTFNELKKSLPEFLNQAELSGL